VKLYNYIKINNIILNNKDILDIKVKSKTNIKIIGLDIN